MPIYEYLCKECEHQFDTLQKMSDDPLKDCPECMAPALTKLVSAPSFRLSGTGWYETDFKTDKDKKKNLTDSKASTSSDKTADNKSENKTESSSAKTEKPKRVAKNSSSTNAKTASA